MIVERTVRIRRRLAPLTLTIIFAAPDLDQEEKDMTKDTASRPGLKITNFTSVGNGGDGLRVEGPAHIDLQGADIRGNRGAGMRMDLQVSGRIADAHVAGNAEGGLLIGLGPIGLNFPVPEEQLKEVADVLKSDDKSKWIERLKNTKLVMETLDKGSSVIPKLVNGSQWILDLFKSPPAS